MFDKDLLKKIDWITILLVLTLFIIGLTSIASIMADPFDGTEASIADYLDKLNLYYVKKQLVNFMIGFAAMLVFMVVDYKVFKFLIKYVYAANLVLLIMIFAAGKTRGIAGWFKLDFIDRALQPGELCKISIIVTLSKYVSDCMDKEGKFRGLGYIIKTTMYCAVPTVLVMMQPDFGTAFVFICIMVFIYFIGRISWGYTLPELRSTPGVTLSPFLTFTSALKGRTYSFFTSPVASSLTLIWLRLSELSMSTIPSTSQIVAQPLGFLTSKSSSTRGRPCVMSPVAAIPPVWKVRIVSCVPGSPMDCAAIVPTASPTCTGSVVAMFLP